MGCRRSRTWLPSMSASEDALPGEEGGGKEVDGDEEGDPETTREYSPLRLRSGHATIRYLAKPLGCRGHSAVAPL